MISQGAIAGLPVPGGNDPGGGCRTAAGLPERVLHFPTQQAMGQIVLIDESYIVPEISRDFHPGYVFTPTRYLGPAQGEVRILGGQRVCLHLGGQGVTRQQCFDCLQSLNPNDVQDLDFLQPLQVDDTFLPYVARLTGITHFCPVTAHFSGQGWATLKPLTALTHICTPYGLTDAEMAGIATLATVDEMEMIATKLTDAGLASIARLRNLQVLHLEGTMMMTDEGLKVLTTLPRLRHLRLSGHFTDRGLAYLAAAPAIKTLWLETPRATEEGLQSLAQIRSLERLTVPWLDHITHRSMVFLRAMPRLKALGVGAAAYPDRAVAALASLPNLEVLALKGSPALTDRALPPLAAMPKLRALEIYNSRITEQGLASLAACKNLDSIQIRSSVPVSDAAVARLKKDLPNLRTVGVYPSQPTRGQGGPKILGQL
jgi:hypothetical protein